MMRVPMSTWATAVAVGALVAAPAAAAPGHGPHGGARGDAPYGARLAACHRSPRAEARLAVVSAAIRPLPTATRMALKIDLYERPLGGGRWAARTDVPGLGSWTAPSDPSVGRRATDLFKYRQAVARLDVPFAYRFRVAFRWLDAQGAVVRETAARTGTCREPDLRPDLAIASVRVRSSARVPGSVRYTAVVRNDGRTAARGVGVGATLPGETASRVRYAGRIEAGASATVVLTGPGCAAGAGPVFTADPAGTVEESDEANNGFTLTCPVP